MNGSVLGIDMACSWRSLGSAVLEFSSEHWTACKTGILEANSIECDPFAVAEQIERIAQERGCLAVGIDGPHAWRNPDADRSFVGRLSEKLTRTPGKTGAFGKAYPGTWLRWVSFSISVFEYLLSMNHAVLANDATLKNETPPSGKYYLLECFPTSTWRACGLDPLKGHRIQREEILAYAEQLRLAYDLPQSAVIDHHDNLQAIVSALPAAGLVGGPCIANPLGEAAWMLARAGTPDHLVEGLIWDATPSSGPKSIQMTKMIVAAKQVAPTRPAKESLSQTEPVKEFNEAEVIAAGVALFVRLVQHANSGLSIGVGYADFVARIHAVTSFQAVKGRAFAPTDIGPAVLLALRITQAAGGRRKIEKNGIAIQAGMDTFIWNSTPPYQRSLKAWQNESTSPPYSPEEWSSIFPAKDRRLLR